LEDALRAVDPTLLPLLPDMKIGDDGKPNHGNHWSYGTWTLYPDHVSVDLNSSKTSGAALIRHVREQYWAREGIL
jgi:hypothetical protein